MAIERVQPSNCCQSILYKFRSVYDKIKELAISIFRSLFCLKVEAPKKLVAIDFTFIARENVIAEVVDQSLCTCDSERTSLESETTVKEMSNAPLVMIEQSAIIDEWIV